MIVRDFNVARTMMNTMMVVKFDWVKRLPWLLAILSYHDQGKARRDLAVAFEDFQAQAEEVRELHHPRVRELFAGDLLEDFQSWQEGALLEDLPRLHVFAIELACILLCERGQEGEHATVKTNVRSKRHGPVLPSLARRAPMMEAMLEKKLESLEALVKSYDEVRRTRTLPLVLGCGFHPRLLDDKLYNGPHQQYAIVRRLIDIEYRCDPSDQFQPLDSQHRQHEQSTRREQSRQEKIAQQSKAAGERPQPVSAEGDR